MPKIHESEKLNLHKKKLIAMRDTRLNLLEVHESKKPNPHKKKFVTIENVR